MSNSSEAQRLKAEGDDLVFQQDYAAALSVYTRALVLDGDNAVLYTSRALCHYHLDQLDNSLEDATKATELSPSYWKGWQRLAMAQESISKFVDAVASWKKAISALPQAEMNDDSREKKLAQIMGFYFDCKDRAVPELLERAREQSGGLPGYEAAIYSGQKPRDVAESTVLRLNAEGNTTSSAYVLLHAIADFDKGLQAVQAAERWLTTGWDIALPNNAGFTIAGDGILALSDAMSMDPRSLHVDKHDFSEITKKTITYEIHRTGAPDPGQRYETMIQAFRHMLEQDGWDHVRQAIKVSIRSLFLRGHMATDINESYATGFDYYEKAMRLLNWGRTEWADVHPEDRGAIFSDTMYAAVARDTLVAYKQAYIASHGRSRQFQLGDLLERADALIAHSRSADTSQISDGSHAPGLRAAFVVYPEAQAHAIKAWALSQYASSGLCKDAEEKNARMQQSVEEYRAAADLYPEDEEYHAVALLNVLTQMFRTEAKLRVTLPVMKRLLRALPGIVTVWEYSALMQGSLERQIHQFVEFYTLVMNNTEEGRPGYGTDDVVEPGTWFSEI